MTNRTTRALPLLLTLLLATAFGCGGPSATATPDFDVVEASVAELQAAMTDGLVTSAQLVDLYLARIQAYDRAGPALNTMTRLNPRARDQAVALDQERAAGTVRGPLHGIPVVMKDNYDVAWMPTTGSSLALAGLQPVDNAFQVEALLAAGAIILGKTNLHELAAGITTISSLGGQTRNPYDPRRNPGGSSGGTGAAVAASFAAVGWGTDTCGSIRIPASVHNLFGLRPTKGLSSIDGILPLSHSQDTGGPLARTVADLAIALDATVGRDPADPATAILDGRPAPSFVATLDSAALAGARIGVIEAWTPTDPPAGSVGKVIRDALADMEALGAEVVDIEIPDFDAMLANTGLIALEFKFDLADYLAAVPDAPVRSLQEIVDAGLHHEALDGTFRRRAEGDSVPASERAEVEERRRALIAAVVALMDRERLDALAYPTMRQETAIIGSPPEGSTCFLSAHTGLPALTIPAGFTATAMPVGVELLGRPLDDPRLVALAYAFEAGSAASPRRRAPLRTPALVEGTAPPPVALIVEPPPDGADAMAIEADFEVYLAAGALAYRVGLGDVAPSDVYGVVLRRVGGEGPVAVVLRLGGPGEADVRATVGLTARLLDDIVAGDLELVVSTRAGIEHRAIAPVTPRE